MRCWLWLGALTVLVAGMLALTGWELIARPSGLWIVAGYVAGTATGIALDRWRPKW